MNEEEREPRALPASELQRRAISGSVWTVINTAVFVPVAFVANAIVARSLGVTNYGDLAFLTVALTLATQFANLGFSNALIQRGVREEAAGRRVEADVLFGRNLGFQLVAQIPLLVIIVVALTRGKPFWETAVLSGVDAVTGVFSGAPLSFTIENRTAVGAKLGLVMNVFVQAVAVGVAVSTKSASAVWVARAVVPAIAVAVGIVLLDEGRRRAILTPRLPRGLGRSFWRFALLTWAAGLVGLLVFSRSEIFLLRAFDQHEALGVFALAFGISQQLTAPADSLLLPLLAAVTGIVGSWPERARQAFERSTRLSSLVCGGLAAVAVPTLTFAIPVIYGHEFDLAAWVFAPLALASMFQSVNNPVSVFVNARERGGLRLKACSVALVVDVAVAVALIPPFGVWGAVVSNALGQLVAIGWLAAAEPFVKERGVRGFLDLQRAFIAGVTAMGGSLLLGALVANWSALLASAVALVVGAVLFVVGLRLLRCGLTTEDRDALLQAVGESRRRYVVLLLRPVSAVTVR